MNNTKILNFINLNGGSYNIINKDETSSTSEYVKSYLDEFNSSEIVGGKGLTKSKIIYLSKLNQPQNVDSEEELENIINSYTKHKNQTGGDINKKLKKINKQIEILKYKLF